MNCVALCAESETSAIALGDFLDHLRLLGWNETDIQAVREAVQPMLGELKAGDTTVTGTTKVVPQPE